MKRTLVLALALLASATSGWAQVGAGNIFGVVTDESGSVLPGATISLTSDLGNRATSSDSRGEFRFISLDRGRYKMTVTLNGSVLSLTLPGQAPLDLVPAYGTTLTLKGLNGFAARFVVEMGKATTLKLIQPNGVFTLTKASS